MKKTIIIVLASTAAVLPTFAQNVLTSGGFEGITLGAIADNGGVNQWGNYNDTSGNAIIEGSLFHGGSQALEFNVFPTGSQNFSIIYQNTGTSVPFVLGTWNYSFWVYTSGTTGSFNYGFFSSNSGNVDIHEGGGGGTVSAAALTANTWTQITGSFVVDNLGSDRMKGTFDQFNSTGTFYIDDVNLSIQAVPEPSTLALAGMAVATFLGFRRRI